MIARTIVSPNVLASYLQSWWFQSIAGLLGMLGAPSALGLWFGMCFFWFIFDRSHHFSPRVWLVVLILGNFLAAPLYYFLVYRRVVANLE
jgi:hypothetical protein